MFEEDADGMAHWSTDPNGISLVTEWPSEGAEVPWGPMQQDWHVPCQEGQKAGDPLKKVRKAVKQCENCGDDYDWMPSHSGWWADWERSALEVGRDIQKVASKVPHHPDLDPTTNRCAPIGQWPPPKHQFMIEVVRCRLPGWQLPKKSPAIERAAAAAPPLSTEQLLVEPLQYTIEPGITHSRSNRDRAVRRVAGDAASSSATISHARCHECGSAEHGEGVWPGLAAMGLTAMACP